MRSRKPSVWIERRKTKKGYWVYRVRAEKDGERIKDIPCSIYKDEAVQVAARLRQELWEGRLGLRRTPDVTISEWRDAYLQVCSETHRPNTIQLFDKPAIEGFSTFVGDKLMRSVNLETAAGWKTELQKTLGPTSVRMRLAHAKAGFSWAKKRDWIADNPFDRLDFPRANVRTKVLTNDDIAICYKTFPPEITLAFTVLLYTGLRKDELLRLSRSQIITTGNPGLWRLTFTSDQTKNHKAKSVELHPKAREAIEKSIILSKSERVFDFLTDDKIEYWFRKVSKKIGPIGPHTVKHTFCTRFMETTGDLESLILMTGNSRRSLESHYLHLSKPRSGAVLALDFG